MAGRLLLALLLIPLKAFSAPTPFRVVIDPGHGGSDHGTVFDNGVIHLAEKDVTLTLARQVARQLRARGILVTLTRGGDKEVPLPSRTALANRIGADIFLSIHMNSTQTPMVADAEGIETYILNHATDAASRRLAHLENAVISAPTENNDVALILKDLRLDANLPESKRLACSIQGNLVGATRKALRHTARDRDRGVKQGLFYVLLGADMPSVLVEAGFLSSPRDRALVTSPRGRLRLSTAIASAIEGFRKSKGNALAQAALSTCKVF